jgi:DNA-binding response OmpR family regulator
MSANTAMARRSVRSPSPSNTRLTWIRVSNAGAFIAQGDEEAGFDIRQVNSLPEGKHLVPTGALVLDFGAGPYSDDMLRGARAAYHTQAFVVIGPGGPDHTIRALDAGADDYLPARAHPREVFARVRAVLRGRTRGTATAAAPRNAIGAWTFDRTARTLFSDAGVTQKLNDTEACLVRIFLAEPNHVLAVADIAARLTAMRGVSFGRQSIAVLVNGLRRKLGEERRLLMTVRGRGVMLTA